MNRVRFGILALVAAICFTAAAHASPANRYNQTHIIADSCAIGMADSSAILNVKGLKILGVGVRVSGPAITVTGAIELRWHAGNSATAVDSFTVRIMPDSVGLGQGGIAGVGIAPSLARATYEVVETITHDNAASSPLAAKFGTQPAQFVSADRWSCPRADCTFDYVSVRWRTLACSSGNAPYIKIWLLVAPR